MPLHIERITSDIQRMLVANYETALSSVYSEQGAQLPLNAPGPQSYFFGPPSKYRAFDCTAVFIIPQKSRRQDLQGMPGNSVLLQQHQIGLNIVVEATTVDDLERMSWRHAQAVDTIFHNAEICPTGNGQYSAQAFITDIDYGTAYVRQHGDEVVFRNDIWLDVQIKHRDQYTTLPLPGAA